MTVAYSGRDAVLQINSSGSPATYVTIAGMRDVTISVAETEVDVTTKDDSGVRYQLEGNILSTVSVSGSGVLTNSAQLPIIRAAALAGTHRGYKVLMAEGASSGGNTYTGSFRITSFEEQGAHDGEINFSISLSSSGAVAIS